MQPSADLYDALGNPILVGAFVTYPGRNGASLWMNLGRVTEIKTDPREPVGICMMRMEVGSPYPPSFGFTGQLGRVIVIPESHIPLASREALA